MRRLSVHLKRTSSDSQLREAVPGIGGIYDDKIIRVVGAVFAELDDVSAEGGLGGDAIEMVLRDLVSEALEAVDTLCAMAISSSHTSSSVSTASALVTGQAGRTTSDVHRHDQVGSPYHHHHHQSSLYATILIYMLMMCIAVAIAGSSARFNAQFSSARSTSSSHTH